MKMLPIILILGTIGIFSILPQFHNPTTQTSTDKKTPTQEITVLRVTNERGSTNMVQVVETSGMMKTHSLSLEEKHRQVWACKKLLKDRKTEGLPINDIPDTGMITPEKALQVAFQHVKKTSNINRLPDVVLIEGFYIVSYYKHENPFRSGKVDYDSRIAVDAWTGEFISVEGLTRGVYGFVLDRKTGAGFLGETPQAATYQGRIFDHLKTLDLRVINGQPLDSEPQPGMIIPEEAIRVAREQVVNHDYDQNKEPWPILVDDVYIVTFWKKEIEKLPDGSPAYDTRVGIDAYSGEFVAMEITR